MKKFMFAMSIIYLVLAILLLAPAPAHADCGKYWDELVNQCFETTIDDIDYTVCFGDSVYGPCPGGIAVLGYTDTQIIDEVEYQALIETDIGYYTTYDAVIIEGLEFILVEGRLIMLPEDPLILQHVINNEEEEEEEE